MTNNNLILLLFFHVSVLFHLRIWIHIVFINFESLIDGSAHNYTLFNNLTFVYIFIILRRIIIIIIIVYIMLLWLLLDGFSMLSNLNRLNRLYRLLVDNRLLVHNWLLIHGNYTTW